MKYLSIILLIFSLKLIGQNGILLIQKNKPNKQRTIIFDRKFEIKTTDTICTTEILNYKHPNISIIRHYLKKDTAIKNSFNKDKGISHPTPVYNWVYDTLKININTVEYIKFDRYKNKAWLIPFGILGVGAVSLYIFTPLVAITKGNETANSLVIGQLALFAICIPPILIGTRKVNYDLKNKWKVKTVD